MLAIKALSSAASWQAYLREQAKQSVLCFPGIHGGGPTVFDYSPQQNHGTIYGAIWKRLPTGLWYLDYDGDDYVTSARVGVPTVRADLTVQVVFRCNASGATQTIAATMWGTDEEWLIRVGADNKLFAGIFHTAGDYHASVSGLGDDLDDNVWRLAAFTWNYDADPGSRELISYLNGVALGSDTSMTGTLATETATKISLGATEAGATWNFTGSIALVIIEAGVKSPVALLQDYNQLRHLFGV